MGTEIDTCVYKSHNVVVVQLLSHVRLFRDPVSCILQGSSVHGIFQARILEWVVISFSKELYLFPSSVYWEGLETVTPQ